MAGYTKEGSAITEWTKQGILFGKSVFYLSLNLFNVDVFPQEVENFPAILQGHVAPGSQEILKRNHTEKH